ncbi:asparagine synthase (glutamine-hydrolyzing) [Limobrevibacterium gyesilva]|uniref:asparagine synthase (glutamine-hydrolyzing) n=1 Tax=Limobrevibacterium gyesilva TaxID=2991712 RepID=A0AA42CCW8_9PROT|nr:asparagine synthase (glutamine-hydrolyzing) [Limobrevibacterium gyesilva]MCW3474093.1 asparagine synthase (glutamine-hydrolyzing) [Limobrevibacterium gyesilva]
MCGIAGVMMRDGSAPDQAVLDRLLAALAHRGPDGQGRLVRGDTALVHTRLAIIDLETGDQPLFAPSGAALVGNGEIYNNPELRAQMAGTPFRTRSDCEPALFLYEAEGEDFAARLRGMFALAIHDPARGRVVLTRDPFGIKPLYYVQMVTAFAFASEPQALIAAGFARAAAAPRQRAELLQLKFTTGAETAFPGIERVLPGETLVIERGAIVERRRRAALPPGPPEPIGHAEAMHKLDAVLLDSVAVHLRSDVPYGLFLSGGIDSAALLALMTRATGQRIQALTVGWEGAGAVDESHEAARLAKVMGAACHRLEMTARDFWTLAPRIAAAIDDPTADAAVLPTYMLGQAAAGSLKVTLCGEGADELFGGYSRYRKRRAPWRWLARKPRTKGLFGGVAALAGWRDGIAAAEGAVAAGRSPLQATQEVDVLEWLPNDLLTKLDRCLMAHGVEGRTPFLDPVVADFAFRLPDAEKVGLRFGKVLLRDWLARAFPEAGAYARKKGFKPPVGAWMAAQGLTLGRLVAAQPGIAEVLPADQVAAAFAAAEANPQRAWSLLYYALWHSHHVMGLPADGDIGAVLEAASRPCSVSRTGAARAMARP